MIKNKLLVCMKIICVPIKNISKSMYINVKSLDLVSFINLKMENKATKICSHFNSKVTYAVYCMDKNIIYYNLDYDKTKCGFIHLLKDN